MDENVTARKRSVESRSKVKTGCATCRIRKVKCDESKPFCRKCVSTGRTCDGYESPFRFFIGKSASNAPDDSTRPEDDPGATWPNPTGIGPQDIVLLHRYFSTKTRFDVSLDCDKEARLVLQASLSDPHVRNAVISLKALREDFDKSGNKSAFVTQQTDSYTYGLQQYNVALKGLASKMSSPGGSDALRSILLCCQVFISIEQVRGNFAAMALHIIRGLGIMHEYRARPYLVTPDNLISAYRGQLPFLDVFIIKIFAAPCRFTEQSSTIDIGGTTLSGYSIQQSQQPAGPGDLRTISPNLRAELVKIAEMTLQFLDKVSNVDTIENALLLMSEKAGLLDSLETWLRGFELARVQTEHPSPEPISMSFIRLFHMILKIILLEALGSSPDSSVSLQIEKDRFQAEASNVAERARAHRKNIVNRSD